MIRRMQFFTALAIMVTPLGAALAQGTLSTQGFGYPPGQLSTRARATGGGLGQFDPDNPLNPAAIATSGDPRMFLQYEPEFRRLSRGDSEASTVTARFPVASISVPLTSRGSLGLSMATFLDRSSSTSVTGDKVIGDETYPVTETNRVLGAINDVRLAFGYSPGRKFQAGVAGHVYTGQNRLFFTQTFPDSLGFIPVSQTSTLGFTGFAVSAGVLLRPARVLGLALSGRKGASIEARSDDSVVSKANVPDKFSAAISYEGIAGTSISAHVGRELWSSLNGLGSAAATSVDTWEGGVGIEALGPRLAQRQTIVRLGGRYRTLPFLAAGNEVREIAFGGGLGAQFFRNRAAFDVSLERASRKLDGSSIDASERAYTLSFGLRVRP